jgi:hypothetical protein
MVDSTATVGNLLKGGLPFLHNFGLENTFVGSNAGNLTMTGCCNTGTGEVALLNNTVGFDNTAIGDGALARNTTSSGNIGIGRLVLVNSTSGTNNTAVGTHALQNSTTGGDNIAIGVNAGFNVSTGSSNIYIGTMGAVSESNTIRLGTGQTHFFAAGVSGAQVSGGVPVLVNSNGQLGIAASSRRFKQDVQDMEGASDALLRLRPVTFHYKGAQGGPGQLEYGLIAEEVAEVFPELVQYGDDGQPFTVRYHLLNAMLLNLAQKQERQLKQQQHHLDAQVTQIAELKQQQRRESAQVAQLKEQVDAVSGLFRR